MKDRIREARETLGLSQAQFAEKVGLTKNYISLVENGKRSLSARTVADICRIFGISEDWMLTGDGSIFEISPEAETTAEYLATVMKEFPETFRSRFIAATKNLTLEDWEDLARIAETLLQGKKKDADQ